MDYKIIHPPPQLVDDIRLFWYLEFNAIKDQPFVHHAFAHHCCEVVFSYKGQFRFQMAVDSEKNLCSGIYAFIFGLAGAIIAFLALLSFKTNEQH